MASLIDQASQGAGQGYQGAGRLADTGIGSLRYQAVNIETPKAEPSTLHQVFDQFLATSSSIAKEYVDDKKQSAENDYLIKKAQLETGKIPQQEFNDWVNKGDVFYKDNPYARKVARKDIGLQARHEADASVMDDIRAGKFKTRDEMDSVLRQKRQDVLKTYQTTFGIADDDHDVLTGAGNGLVESDIALHEGWSSWDSENTRNANQNLATVHVNGLVSDASITDPKVKASALAAKQNELFVNGVFPDSSSQIKMVTQTSAQLASQPNGGELVKEYGEQTIAINGKPVKIKDVIGDADFQIHVKTGDESTLRLSAKRNDEYHARLIANQNLPLEEREADLQKIETEFKDIMPAGGEQTEATAKLTAMRADIQTQKEAAARKLDGDNAKATKLLTGESKMTTQLQAALSTPGGKFSKDTVVWYESEWGSKDQAYSNVMNKTFDAVMSDPKLTDAQKNAQILRLADVDSANHGGVISGRMNSLVSGATAEWHSMAVTGDVNQPQNSMKQLSQLYETNPNAVRQLLGNNKDADAILARLDVLKQGGLTMPQMVKAEQYNANFSDEEKKQMHKDVTDDIGQGGMGLSPTLQPQAETVYDYWYGATGGNKDIAKEKMRTFIRSNTTFFDSRDDGDGQLPDRDRGGVPSYSLQIGQDTSSIDVNRAIIKERLDKLSDIDDAIIEPWNNGGFHLFSPTTNKSEYISRADLEKMYQERLKAQAPAVDANKAALAKEKEETIKEMKSSQAVKKVRDTVTPASALGFGNTNYPKRK